MVTGALSPIDYGVVALFLATLVAVGYFFAQRQSDTAEFLLGSRSIGALPLGLSLAATLGGAAIVSLPGDAYEQGLKCWLVPLSFWLILPIVVSLAIPIYRGLGLVSISEYLEYRFDSRVRRLASALIVAWRVLWLGVLVSAIVKTIVLAAGWQTPVWTVIVPLGIVATLVAYFGGMRAVVWSSAMQAGVMFAGIAVVVVGIWVHLDSGPARVMEVAKSLGRLPVADASFRWNDVWTIWAALPNWFLFALSLLVADQISVQRLLSAQNVNTARTSYLICSLTLTFLLAGLIYVGLGLLAYFHDHPDQLRADWVANLDGRTHEPIRGDDGNPLLDPRNPAHRVTPETIDRLIAEGRLLRPNDKLPFVSADELIDPASGRVIVERLAMRRPRDGTSGGELIMRRGNNEELLPQFVARRLTWGAAGIVLAALLATALGALESGVHSLGTLILHDLQSGTNIDLQHVRRLIVVIGLAITALATVVGAWADVANVLAPVTSALAAPLLALFLLGMLTRRVTATAALAATVLGCAFMLGLEFLEPRSTMSSVWSFVFGFVATFLVGYLLSYFLGRRLANVALRGLVFRCGTLGLRAGDEEVPIISGPSED